MTDHDASPADSRLICRAQLKQTGYLARVNELHSPTLRASPESHRQVLLWYRQLESPKSVALANEYLQTTPLPFRHHFLAVWLYYRFNLSHCDIEDLLAERGINVSRESIRLWCIKFGAVFARRLKRKHRGYGDAFFIDEVLVNINCNQRYL